MVHEEFRIKSGRGVHVRVDDCTPQERREVSEFFEAVRRLKSLERMKLPATLAVLLVPPLSFPIGEYIISTTGFPVFVIYVLASAILAASILGAMRWFFVRWSSISQRISMILERNERCMRACEDLRRMSRDHWYLLEDACSRAVRHTDGRRSRTS